jgi:outer membrane protein assembly factor BamB
VYYIRGTEHLSALNITSNEVLWENSDFFFSNPALNEEESVLYSFLNGSRIGAFSAHNGSLIAVSENVPQKWSFISIPKLVLAPNGNVSSVTPFYFAKYSEFIQVTLTLINILCCFTVILRE